MRARRVVIAALVAACNHGGNAMPDAAIGADATDAAIDSPPPVPGRVDITVRTWLGDGAPDATAVAMFMDPAGNVVQHGLVDADGNAHADVVAGSSVTVLQATNDPQNAYRRYVKLTTIRDVHPGDHLVAGRSRDPNQRNGATDVMWANYTDASPQSGPGMLLACADAGPSGTPGQYSLVFHASCTTPTFDMLTIDDDPTNGRQYVWQPGLTHVADGTIVIPNTWQPIGHNATKLEHVPDNFVLGVEADTIVGGLPTRLDNIYDPAPTAGTHDLSLQYAPVPTPTLVIVRMSQGLRLMHRHVLLTTGSAAALDIDVAAQPIPQPGSTHQTATDVTWTESGSGTGDMRVVYWSSHWSDANGVARDALWTFVENPQSAPSTTLPILPGDYSLDDPRFVDPSRTTMLQGAGVNYIEWDDVPDYSAARALGWELVDVENRELTTDHRAHMVSSST